MDQNLTAFRFKGQPRSFIIQVFPGNKKQGVIKVLPEDEDFLSASALVYRCQDSATVRGKTRKGDIRITSVHQKVALYIPERMDKETFMQYSQFMKGFEEKVGCILAEGGSGSSSEIIEKLRYYFRIRALHPVPESFIVTGVHPGPAEIRVYKILGFDGYAIPASIRQKQPERISDTTKPLRVNPTDGVLELLRAKLDTTDQLLLDLISNRLTILSEVADLKARDNLPAFQPERWRKIMERISETAANKNADPEILLEIYEHIHASALKLLLHRILKQDL